MYLSAVILFAGISVSRGKKIENKCACESERQFIRHNRLPKTFFITAQENQGICMDLMLHVLVYTSEHWPDNKQINQALLSAWSGKG